jgi:hypothetical protein
MKCHEFYAVFSLLFLIWKSVLRYNKLTPINYVKFYMPANSKDTFHSALPI